MSYEAIAFYVEKSSVSTQGIIRSEKNKKQQYGCEVCGINSTNVIMWIRY